MTSETQQELHYEPGDLIFSQGKVSRGMLLVLNGTVELTVTTPEGERTLTRLGPGDFVGDMALVQPQPRAATARALTVVTAEWIDDDSFESRLLDVPDRRDAYVALLMQRVRMADSLLRLEWHKQDPAYQTAAGILRAGYLEALPATVTGRGEWLDLRMVSAPGIPPPRIDVIIPQVPFVIGRLTFPLRPEAMPARRLSIPDKEPYQLCVDHCEIVRVPEGLAVRDLGSRLGTNVNGVQIGLGQPVQEALLQPGTNTLRLGGETSHYQFLLELAAC